MPHFSLGCAIWSYAGWVGDLFPEQSKPSDFLRLYGQRFTAVEGNTTFYAVPEEATVQKWASETPEGFRFCPKLPKELSHAGPLTPSLPKALQFLERMRGLGAKLGTILVQLPPQYSPDQLGDLRSFLRGWPCQEAKIAVEVRNLAWFREPHQKRLGDLLSSQGAARAILDSRPIYERPQDPDVVALCKKPQVPLTLQRTTELTLVRFVSHPDLSRNTTFLQEWASRVDAWLKEGTSIDFFFHCPVEEKTPRNAKHFQELLEKNGAAVPPLPWDKLPSRAQLKLF